MLLIEIQKLIRKFRCFGRCFGDVPMSFRCVGTTPNPVRAAMRPPVTTNGNAVCAKSLVSNVQYVRTKLLSRSPTISLSGICGVRHQRVPPSSWVIYPMLPDGTCYLLVADFDREDWRRDSLAYVGTCDLLHVPCALERSRSGNGHMLGYSSKSQSPLRRRAPRFLHHHRYDGAGTRYRLSVLRPVLSEPGHDADRRLRQPHCAATPGSSPPQ